MRTVAQTADDSGSPQPRGDPAGEASGAPRPAQMLRLMSPKPALLTVSTPRKERQTESKATGTPELMTNTRSGLLAKAKETEISGESCFVMVEFAGAGEEKPRGMRRDRAKRNSEILRGE